MSIIVDIMEEVKTARLKHLNLANLDRSIDLFRSRDNTTGIGSFGELLTFLSNHTRCLKYVETVDLTSNKLTEIPEFVFSLKRLKKLDLYRNRIDDLPDRMAKLNRLEIIDLGENRFSALPRVLFRLTGLKGLYCDRNRVTEIPSEITSLYNLEELVLHSNRIGEIPEFLTELERLRDLTIQNNPIRNIAPEIYMQGWNAIKSYFYSLQSGPPEFLYEAKVVIVGDSNTGKTTIAKNIECDEQYGISVHNRTHGIDVIQAIKSEVLEEELSECIDIKLNMWDFGGEGKYREAQQVFFTPNALYLFVTTPTTGDEGESGKYCDHYWLNSIKALGTGDKDDVKNPVIYIVNKADLPGEKEVNRRDLKALYDNIVDFVQLDCKRVTGFSQLRAAIDKSIRRFSTWGIRLKKNWLDVKQRLESMRNETEIIDMGRYEQICMEHGVSRTEGKTLLNYLNTVGSILYFEKINYLHDQVVLNPEWARKAIYSILKYEPACRRGGRFTKNDFSEIWKDFEPGEREQLIHLLEEFELCFQVDDPPGSYLVPALFPDRPPDTFKQNSGDFEIIYECRFRPFIPAGVFSRMVRKEKKFLSKSGWYWKNGAVFEEENETTVLLEECWQDHTVRISMRGDGLYRVFYNLRKHLLDIVNVFRGWKHFRDLMISEWIIKETGETFPIEAITTQSDSPDEKILKGNRRAGFRERWAEQTETNRPCTGLTLAGPGVVRNNILIFSSNPGQDAERRLDLEIKTIIDGWNVSGNRDSFYVRPCLSPTYRDLPREMLEHKPCVVHFCGTGSTEGLMIEDRKGDTVAIPPAVLANLFLLCNNTVKVVVLNASYSLGQARDIAQYIDYVIGYEGQLESNTAIEFAQGFYSALFEGTPLEKAFQIGLNVLMSSKPANSNPPVLIRKGHPEPEPPI